MDIDDFEVVDEIHESEENDSDSGSAPKVKV